MLGVTCCCLMTVRSLRTGYTFLITDLMPDLMPALLPAYQGLVQPPARILVCS